MYSLKLTETAPRAPITTGIITMTSCMRQTFAISSFNNQLVFLYFLKFLIFHPVITWDGNVNYDNLSLLLINKDNVWSSCLDFLIVKSHSILEFSLSTTLSGFCSYQLLALSNPHLPQSYQWIYRATLSCVPSFIFCLRQLTALTHHMGHRFSLTSAHSAQTGFCCAINVKPRIIHSQSLFLGATYQGLSTSFQISLCNPLPSSIPVNRSFSLSRNKHDTKKNSGSRSVEEAKKMKCYNRLIYKQYV